MDETNQEIIARKTQEIVQPSDSLNQKLTVVSGATLLGGSLAIVSSVGAVLAKRRAGKLLCIASTIAGIGLVASGIAADHAISQQVTEEVNAKIAKEVFVQTDGEITDLQSKGAYLTDAKSNILRAHIGQNATDVWTERVKTAEEKRAAQTREIGEQMASGMEQGMSL